MIWMALAGCVLAAVIPCALRHMWTSPALRLPGAGLALDGSIVADDGTVQVSVFAPWNTILVAGVPWCLGAVGIMVSLAIDPRTDVIVLGVLWLSFALLTWRNARRAAAAVAEEDRKSVV